MDMIGASENAHIDGFACDMADHNPRDNNLSHKLEINACRIGI